MSLADVAGSVPAVRHAKTSVATRHVDHFDFPAPIYVGDIVSFYGKLIEVKQTSLTVRVVIRVERLTTGKWFDAGQAEIVYVAVDKEGNPVRVPSLA